VTTATLTDNLEELAEGVLHTYHQSSDVLGPSKISTYLRCPKAFQYQYVERQFAPSSVAAAVGSTVHQVCAQSHHRNWTREDADRAADMLHDLWQLVSPHTADPTSPTAAADIIEAQNVWLPWYLTWTAGQTTIAVEEPWRLTIPGTDVELRGTVDRFYRQDGNVVLSDLKTGKRAPRAADLANDLQLTLYAWAGRQMGLREDRLEIVQIRDQALLQTTRTDAYIQGVIETTVLPVHRAIQAGLFPANPRSQYGCGYCDYTAVCPVGRS
jgi:putative RecB family exonuclease